MLCFVKLCKPFAEKKKSNQLSISDIIMSYSSRWYFPQRLLFYIKSSYYRAVAFLYNLKPLHITMFMVMIGTLVYSIIKALLCWQFRNVLEIKF